MYFQRLLENNSGLKVKFYVIDRPSYSRVFLRDKLKDNSHLGGFLQSKGAYKLSIYIKWHSKQPSISLIGFSFIS